MHKLHVVKLDKQMSQVLCVHAVHTLLPSQYVLFGRLVRHYPVNKKSVESVQAVQADALVHAEHLVGQP